MDGAALRFARRYGRVTAFALVTGVVFALFATTPAVAQTPHVRSTVQTSSCSSCHSTHAAANRLLLRAEDGEDSVSGSCLRCHDGADPTATNIESGPENSFGLPSGHSLHGDGPGTATINGCATCHEIHGASENARMIPARIVNGAGVSSAGRELCLACHDSSDAWFGPGYPSTAEPTRDATGYPVAGTWPGSATYESTSNAHRLIPETTRTVGMSEPVGREQGSCLYCHSSHGGANAYDGLVTTYTVPAQSTLASDQADGSYAALCFTCHGGQKPSGFSTTPVNIKQFATTETTASAGHRIVTSGGTLPVGSPLPCFECHNPHGSQRGNASLISDERGASLDTTSAAGVRAFCFTCHATSDTLAGWDSEVGTYTAVSSADEVVGLPRDGGVLRLPDTDGHRAGDAQSCYGCHGDSYTAGGYNVHNPDPQPGSEGALLAGASLSETITVPPASVDVSPAVEPTASVDATASADASASASPTESVGATGGVEPTASVEATDTGGWLPELPSLPETLGLLFGSTGAAVSRPRE